MKSEIQTRRLLLRRLTDADAAAIQVLANDRDIARMLCRMPHPYPAGAARDLLAMVDRQWRRGTGTIFAIEYNNRLAGMTGIERHPSDPAMELGYWLGREFWRRGIASEAARALIGAYFENGGGDEIVCECYTDNAGSEAVIRACGFRQSGYCWRYSRGRGSAGLCRTFRLRRAQWRAATMDA